jgi:hypothetical protein
MPVLALMAIQTVAKKTIKVSPTVYRPVTPR